ncbi:MAG TPA: cobalamin-independent methionine synthase II family protein [Candidatus Binataceae bacterium]|nr:cobalamin-independent methionine synthase II family protein [Candidatus Binataceae bacterium]
MMDKSSESDGRERGVRILPTTVVGSYPQPEWLVDRRKLQDAGVPRVRSREIWRVSEEFLEQAQDDATLLAIRAMERAGIDIITDGEMRRESYSNHFTTALEGIDAERPFNLQLAGRTIPVPRIVGKIRRARPVEVRDVEFLRGNTGLAIKATLPGPFTMAQQAHNEFYKDTTELLMDLAAAVNQEARDLKAAGADVIQLDEPWLRMNPEGAKQHAVAAINRALEGIPGQTAVHLCFGYAQLVKNKPHEYAFLAQLGECAAGQISIEAAQPNIDLSVLREMAGKKIILGVVSIDDAVRETPAEVAARIRKALSYVSPENLIAAPDCGMKYLPRDIAFAKLQALAQGAAAVRAEL